MSDKVKFPTIAEAKRIELLALPSGKVRAVLDTDTFNEIDDQFALTHAILSPDNFFLEAVYAAPFHNNLSSGAGDGMEQSYQEILKILKNLNVSADDFAYRGSTEFMTAPDKPVDSDSARNLIERVQNMGDELLYVLTIGAPTNVSSAILLEPEIIKKIVVVWLGGAGLDWHTARGFNLSQDIFSSRILFNSGVPLVHLPMGPVTSHLLTTLPEIEHHLSGKGDIGDYLVEIFRNVARGRKTYSRVLWDLSATGYLVNPDWISTEIVHSPILTDQQTWSFNKRRHFITNAIWVNRDAIFNDLFEKVAAYNG